MITKGSKEFGRSHPQVALLNSVQFWLMITCRAYMHCLISALQMTQRAECACYVLLPFRCFRAKLLFIASDSEL